MSNKSAVFVGEQAAVAKCASVWLDRGNSIAFVVSGNTEVLRWASERGIPIYQSVNDLLGNALWPDFDWLFSVVNFEILPPEIIAAARVGAANFHDGPLPRHAGLNAPIWALLAGESEHGITWHLMTDEVDAGDILIDINITVSPSETALSLNARCLEAALEGFSELAAQIENGTLDPRPQVGSSGTRHLRHALPPAAGRLDFSQPASRVAGFVRALDHKRYYNAVTSPKIEIDGAIIAVSQAEETESDGTPGTVVGISEIAPMPDAERTLILEKWNRTERAFERSGTLHRLFEEQVERDPTRPALEHRGELLSYGSLNDKANRVAHRLRQMGVGPGVLVGLATRRSPLMVIGALAILKAGGGYLPLDPSYPKDRIAQYLRDSGAPVVVTESELAAEYARFDVETLLIDSDPAIDAAPSKNPEVAVRADDLAYLIFTSGSTGQPKGVMICHRNVSNFFAGMDDQIGMADPGVWLAATSLSFDISVLEIFWTLARGFKVVLHEGEPRSLVSDMEQTRKADIDLSLYFWGHPDSSGDNAYDLLLDGAKFADANGFKAVWLPERHFHNFGGLYPNPSVTAAAVSIVTKNLEIRAGSCVAPLHHPARIAEEWAVVGFPTGDGKNHEVLTHPRPVTKELPLWLTTAGNPETWRKSGEMGMHVLTHLLGQSVAEVEKKIGIYHQSLREAGHDPADFTVTLMLHTFIGDNREEAMDVARAPMKAYLSSAVDLVKEHASSFPAFKQRAAAGTRPEIDLEALTEREVDELLEHAYCRYFDQSGLFGSVEDGVAMIEKLRSIGVSEVACLVDFGIPADRIYEGLSRLSEVLRRTRIPEQPAEGDHSISSEISRHGVTHLQCTPSLMRMLAATDETRAALADLQHILLGGEGRIYQTSDLAKWRADGSLELVGRNDQQIKLRGHRIELGEIEAIARSQAKVRQAVASLEQHASGEPQIVLFSVLSPGFSAAKLRDFLSRRLPDHMVPTSFVLLDEMPLTPNGKIDRNALVFEAASPERPVSTPYVEPQARTQAIIAEVWRELLDVPKAGALDDFFELGGDSLSALEASCLISDRLGNKQLSMTGIVQDSVLADLATRLDDNDCENADLVHHLGVAPARKPKVGAR